MTKALQTIEQKPRVYIRDGNIFANSLDVARYFGMGHRSIIAGIERVLAEEDADSRVAYFCKTSIERSLPRGGVHYVDGYEMDETALTLVTFSLTGSAPRRFKLRYIAEFQRMRKELEDANRAPPSPVMDLNDPAFLRGALITYTEKVIALEAKVVQQDAAIAIAAPKVEFYDTYADANGLILLSDIGRALKVGPVVLLKWLVEKRILFRTGRGAPLRAMRDYLEKGWFDVKVSLIGDKERLQTYATPKGLQAIAGMIERQPDLFGTLGQPRLPSVR